MSDAIHGDDKSDRAESLSLQKALYITCFAAAIGSICFLAATFYIHHDEHQVQLYISHHDNKPKEGGDNEPKDNDVKKDDPEDKEQLLSDDNEQLSIGINYSVNCDEDHQ